MKVNAKKFYESVKYLVEINDVNIELMDLSEFKKTVNDEDIKRVKFSGISNKDFILTCFTKKKGE